MKRRFQFAIPLVFFALVILTSCQNPDSLYNKGKYSRVISSLERKGNLNASQYLLKARSHEALEQHQGAVNCYTAYLLSEPQGNARKEAVQCFVKYNKSDSLAVLILLPQDGQDAQVCLYKSYCNLGYNEDAKQILTENISTFMGFEDYTRLLVDYHCDDDYAAEIFGIWYSNIDEGEKDIYLSLLNSFVCNGLDENLTKTVLSLSDILMKDEFYLQDSIRLSLLFKIKGNLLDRLYDKTNARLYWSQALKLNPQDEELRSKIQ